MIGGLFKSASRVALIAAAGVLAGSVAAQAADLGGNCCADLEERVAELEATAARKGNRKVSLTVYGAVNQAIIWHDDDNGYREGKLTVRDNGAYMSRFGFRGEAQIRPDLSAGYVIEIGLSDNDYGTGGENLLIRHNYVYLNSSTFGRINLGQTSQVTDGLYEINLANALVTPGCGSGCDEHHEILSGPFSIFNAGLDGARKQGIYYSTPSLAGFVLSAGYSHDTDGDETPWDADDYYEVALRYAGEFNGVRIAAGVGYRKQEDNNAGEDFTNDSKTYLGSASVMHTPTGLFVSGGYAKKKFDNPSPEADRYGWWVMAGIEKNFFGPGATTLYGEYSKVDYDRAEEDKGHFWGLGVVQKIDAAALDLYLQYRHYKVDHVDVDDTDDANVVTAGAIIKF